MSKWRIDIAKTGKTSQTDRQTERETDSPDEHREADADRHRYCLLSLIGSSYCKIYSGCTNHRLEIQYCITSKCYRGGDSLKLAVSTLVT